MANIPSASDMVNKQQESLRSDEEKPETSLTPVMADSASTSGNVALMADTVNSSGTKPEEQQSLRRDKMQREISHTPVMADSASTSGNVASMADTVNSSGTNPEEQQLSLWREKVEHRLRIAKESLQCETIGFQILKVPEYHRQPPEMFTPLGWRFGLHNLDSVDRDGGSEALKRCVPLLFGLDELEKWEEFSDYVVNDHRRILACYGLHKEDINMEEEEMKQLLAFDALCIACIIERYNVERGERIIWVKGCVPLPNKEVDMFFSSFLTWGSIFDQDLWRVENQIPFELITRTMEYIKRLKTPTFQFVRLSDPNNGNVQLLDMWKKAAAWAIMGTMIPKYVGDNHAQEISDLSLSESHHILDVAYGVICGKEGLKRKSDWSQNSFIHVPSTTQLKRAGVKIEGVAKPLCTMFYNKITKSLILPKMKIHDQTIAFIRNMALYESQSMRGNSMYFEYISLMLDLIRTPADMDYLIKCGVIENECGSRAYEMWQPLNEGPICVPSSTEHDAMKKDINKRYDKKLPKLWREFRTLFCSRPWLIVPVIAATLVTIGTLIQTYATVIGSDRMVPHYKNP